MRNKYVSHFLEVFFLPIFQKIIISIYKRIKIEVFNKWQNTSFRLK